MKHLLFSLLFFLFACKQGKMEKSFSIIPEEKFIILLADYHLAQGISSTSTFIQKTKNIKQLSVSDSIISEYGYNKAIFDSTISWYAADPDKFEVIYDKVITRLSRMQAEVQEKMAKKNEINFQDTIRKKVKRPSPKRGIDIMGKRVFDRKEELKVKSKQTKK
jgi:hypothetical protein